MGLENHLYMLPKTLEVLYIQQKRGVEDNTHPDILKPELQPDAGGVSPGSPMQGTTS